VVVGRGDIDRHLSQLPLAWHRKILFMQEVSRQSLPGFYTGCDIFVAPSLGGESQGIVLLEAMASHRPLIVSNIPGYNEVVRHGVEGLMVPPGDSASLARAISLLAADPELRAKLADAGLRRAAEFSWEVIVPRVEAHYRRALSAMGVSPARETSEKPWTQLQKGL
jgi:phosphatidylinositol alpha-mannosyltransferase